MPERTGAGNQHSPSEIIWAMLVALSALCHCKLSFDLPKLHSFPCNQALTVEQVLPKSAGSQSSGASQCPACQAVLFEGQEAIRVQSSVVSPGQSNQHRSETANPSVPDSRSMSTMMSVQGASILQTRIPHHVFLLHFCSIYIRT